MHRSNAISVIANVRKYTQPTWCAKLIVRTELEQQPQGLSYFRLKYETITYNK